MTRSSSWGAAVAALSLLAAACGGGGGEQEGQGGGERGASLQGQTVEVAGVWTGAEQAAFTKVLDSFAQRTGANVRYTSTGDDIATVLGTRIAGGDVPEVAILPQPGLLADFARRGALKPVEEAAGRLVNENYDDVWRTLGSANNTLYGVWFKAANKSTVWYRVKAFEDAGVEPPKTWEEFVRTARTLSDAGVTPVAIAGGDGWTLTDWFENVYLREAGPDRYDRLSRHEIPWTDDSVKRALRRLAEIWGQPNLIVGGPQGALSTSFTQSVTQVFSEPPRAAMVFEGDFVAGVIAGETKAKPGEDADFFEFPSIAGSKSTVVSGGDVAVMLEDTPAARELIRFLATPEAAEVWAREGGFVSPNQKVDEDAYPDEVTRKAAEALTRAEVLRFDLSDLQPSAFGSTPAQGMWKALQDFLANPGDVDGAAARLEDQAKRAYAGAGGGG